MRWVLVVAAGALLLAGAAAEDAAQRECRMSFERIEEWPGLVAACRDPSFRSHRLARLAAERGVHP